MPSCDCCISHSVMSSGFLHAVACTRVSFIFKAKYCGAVCLCQLIHSSSNGPSGCFSLLALVTNAAVNTGVQRCEHLLFLLWGLCPQMELLDPEVLLCLLAEESPCCLPQGPRQFVLLLAAHRASSFSVSSLTLVIFCSLDNRHPHWCDVVTSLESLFSPCVL